MYIHRLCIAILSLCMYVRNACAIQSNARVCMSVTLRTIEWPKCAPGDNYGPGLLPGLCGPYLMEEHDHKRFKSLPRSLRIAYDFSDTLMFAECQSDSIQGLSRGSLPNGRTRLHSF